MDTRGKLWVQEVIAPFPAMKPEEVLPDGAIGRLPFSKEAPVDWQPTLARDHPPGSLHDLIQTPRRTAPEWADGKSMRAEIEEALRCLDYTGSGESDLLGFLRDLFRSPQYREVVTEAHALQTYSRGIRQMRGWAEQFGELALGPSPDLWQDSDFGRMAKHAIAWSAVVSNVLQESAFYSVAHLLEAQEDLECSVVLAAAAYYKQALQVLRNHLEGAVLQVHFCENPHVFRAWKKNDYRVPPLRGKKGMLKKLVRRNLITQDVADVASNLYGQLNGCMHGAEGRLIHSGMASGDGWVRQFDASKFADWSAMFCEVAEVGLRLQRVLLTQWGTHEHDDRVFCRICHSEDVSCSPEGQGEAELLRCLCNRCGHEMVFDSSSGGQLVHMVTLQRVVKGSEAVDWVAEHVSDNPDDSDARYEFGRLSFALGRTQEGIAEMDRAHRLVSEAKVAELDAEIDAGHETAASYVERGWQYHLSDEYELAVADFDCALALSPKEPDALMRRAITLIELKEFRRAVEDLDIALELQGDGAMLHYYRGFAFFLQEAYDESIEAYTRCIELDPESHVALYCRGLALQDVKRYEEAVGDFSSILAAEPEHRDALVRRGVAYSLAGTHREALDDLNRALDLDRDSVQALANRGVIYGELERYEEALADMNRALELAPDFVEALATRGVVYLNLERPEESLADLSRALETDPDNAWILYNGACAAAPLGNVRQSCAWLEQAIELDSECSELAQDESAFDEMRDEACFRALMVEEEGLDGEAD
ncbi:tetratricopeptide repeat protein [Chloroflexota bacterium]